ncbi:MAG: amidohydrolase family protein [Candidatus Brocadiia bacterium]
MIINCHCHIFDLECVPGDFRRRFMLDLKSHLQRFAYDQVSRMMPGDTRLKQWWQLADLSIEQIARRLLSEMDEAGVDTCVPLMMDMAYCEGYGGTIKDYEDQIAETASAVKKINAESNSPRMLPFIAVDPRRPNAIDLACEGLEKGPFRGVKIYPVMGFTPDEKRLRPLWSYCEENQTPITTHCQNGGVPGLQGYYELAHPKYWRPVLEDFPDLVLNLAHNDRLGSPWQSVIKEIMQTYPRVYIDVSYNLEMWYMPGRYFQYIKRLLNTPAFQNRLLYGTDWYMGRCFWTEETYLKWFREYASEIPWCSVTFTESEWRLLTETNPRRFLNFGLH